MFAAISGRPIPARSATRLRPGRICLRHRDRFAAYFCFSFRVGRYTSLAVLPSFAVTTLISWPDAMQSSSSPLMPVPRRHFESPELGGLVDHEDLVLLADRERKAGLLESTASQHRRWHPSARRTSCLCRRRPTRGLAGRARQPGWRAQPRVSKWCTSTERRRVGGDVGWTPRNNNRISMASAQNGGVSPSPSAARPAPSHAR